MIDSVVFKAINQAWQLNKTNLSQKSNPRYVEHTSPLIQRDGLDCKQLKLSQTSMTGAHIKETFGSKDLGVRLTLDYTVEIVDNVPTTRGLWPLYIALHGDERSDTKTEDGLKKAIKDNDAAWKKMATSYKGAIQSGVWISARGIGNNRDMHFTEANYVLIERLVENMITFGATDKKHTKPVAVDSNRVYLIGFSAGGDGVYHLAPRLAQRFAAVNIGGGHPGSVLGLPKHPSILRNLANTPICLQVGEMDLYDGGRSELVAKSAMDLDELRSFYTNHFQKANPSIYTFEVYIHKTDPDPEKKDNESDKDFENKKYDHRHSSWEKVNFEWSDPKKRREEQPVIIDYAGWKAGFVDGKPGAAPEPEQHNTNAIDWLNKHKRNPLPRTVVWDLSRRSPANDQFEDKVFEGLSGNKTQNYWLDVSGKPVADVGTLIEAEIDKDTSTIRVTSATKYLRILLRPGMVSDMSKVKVEIQVDDQPQTSLGPFKLGWSAAIINQTLARNDPNLIFSSDIVLNLVNNAWKATTNSPAPVRASL